MNDFKERIVSEAKRPSEEEIEKSKQIYIESETTRYRKLYDNPEYREYLEYILGSLMLIQMRKFPRFLTYIDARFKSPESIRKKISNRLNEEGYGFSLDESGNIKFDSRPLLDAFAMKVTSERMPELLYSPDPYINDLIQEKEKNRDFLRNMQFFRGKLNCDAFSYRDTLKLRKPEYNPETREYEDFTVTRIEYYQKCQELLEKLKTLVSPTEESVLKRYDEQLNYVKGRLKDLRALNEPDPEKAKIRNVDLENSEINFITLLNEFEERYNAKVELYNSTMQFLSLFRDDDIFDKLGVSVDMSTLEEKRATSGYESNFIILNTLVGPIEVQIQTLDQHEYGSFGPAAHSKRANKERDLPILPAEGSKEEIESLAQKLAQRVPIYYHITRDTKEPERVIAQRFDDYQNSKAYYSQIDQQDLAKIMDNHEYFERFMNLTQTEAFQKAMVNKGATLGFTPIDIEKYADSDKLKKLKEEAEAKKDKSKKHEDNELEK